MRNLTKNTIPRVLATNWRRWTVELKNDPSSTSKQNKYNNAEIKESLLEETCSKCVYCESKIGDTLYGDIEHIVPKSAVPVGRFCWRNLTIACSVCNTKKYTYYDTETMFLNPYEDDVESMLWHQGPLVFWNSGCTRAEVTVKKLKLHHQDRQELIFRKVEHLEFVNELVETYTCTTNTMKKEIVRSQLRELCETSAKYSGMVRSVLAPSEALLAL